MIARAAAPTAPRVEPQPSRSISQEGGTVPFAQLMPAAESPPAAGVSLEPAPATPEPVAPEVQAAALIAQVTAAPSTAGAKPAPAAAADAPGADVASADPADGAEEAAVLDPMAVVADAGASPAPTGDVPLPASVAVVIAPQVAAAPGTPAPVTHPHGRPAPRVGTAAAAAPSEKPLDSAPVGSVPGSQPFALAQSTAAVVLETASAEFGRGPAAADLQVDRQLDLAQDHAWLDRLAQDIASSAGEASRIRFALAPEHLGRLTVEIANGADGTAVRMTTETEQAQRILADAQPRLVAEARAQGLRVTETNVDLDQRSGQQQSGSAAQQAALAGGGGQGGGDRPRSATPWADTRQLTPPITAEIKSVPNDLYA